MMPPALPPLPPASGELARDITDTVVFFDGAAPIASGIGGTVCLTYAAAGVYCFTQVLLITLQVIDLNLSPRSWSPAIVRAE